MKYYKIISSHKYYDILIFYSNETLNIGDVVSLSIGKKDYKGLVLKETEEPNFSTKIAISDNFSINPKYIEFFSQFKFYNLCNIGFIIKSITSMFSKRIKTHKSFEYNCNIELSIEQTNVVNSVKSTTNLLWGITGSGKTEVYFYLIQKVLKEKKQVLMLLPEIAITEAIVDRFKKNFGVNPILWHSSCKNKTNFQRINSAEPLIVIGARSAIFLPFNNLGLIILDEEHDKSFFQKSPSYHCRDMAVLLGKILQIPVILGTATPSIESYLKAQGKEYNLLKLTTRYGSGQLPQVEHIKTFSFLSHSVIKSTKEAIQRNEQVLFYLNRRGFSPLVSCQICTYQAQCPKCLKYLCFHRSIQKLVCHNCSYVAPDNICTNCSSVNTLKCVGIGIERLKEMIEEKIPESRIELLSSDRYNTTKELRHLLNKIHKKEIDILVATQIMCKGHDFPQLSLVVIPQVFSGFNDFRSSEYMFQNLVQVAGRAGRGSIKGRVLIQSFEETPMLNFLKKYDYEGFLTKEIEVRRQWKLPPFYKIILFKTKKKEEIIKIIGMMQERSQIYHLGKDKFYIKIKSDNFIKIAEIIVNKLKNVNITIDPLE